MTAIDKTLHVGERYESKNGKYEIIEYIGKSHQQVKVRFDLTGSEVICRYDTAYKGLALDPEYINYLYVGKTYDTCCGQVTILEDLGFYKKCYFVKIRFNLTGYECEERLKNILKGYANDPTYFMYTVKDNIYHSNNYGDYKIIAECGTDCHNMKIVRVKFIETGYEYDVRYDAARNGKVKDPTRFIYEIKDKVFHSNNYGDFEVLDQVGWTEDKKHRIVRIRFLTTGTERDVKYDDVINGEVKDTAFVNMYDAREILSNQPLTNVNKIERVIKKYWTNMMNRCYNENATEYSCYGGKGVTVSPEWHDYNNFRNDIVNIPGWINKINNPIDYQLDKDLFQITLPHNMRIYSKNTCVWIRRDINVYLANCFIDNITIHYNCIYQVDKIFYLKTLPDYLPNYGPFDSLDAAINMMNYCYHLVGLDQLMIPVNNTMNIQEIFMHTSDRKEMIIKI